MVIERPKQGDWQPVGDRFQARGRMLPSEVAYHSSWIDAAEARCFQLMEAPTRDSLEPWIAAWADLVDFEIVAVETSADFWSKR